MRVEIFGKKEIVSSAYFEKCTPQTAILVINTHERWRGFDAQGWYYDTFNVYYWHNDGSLINDDEVSVLPENEEEKKLLKRNRFCLHEKEQLQILFIDNSLIGGKV